MAVIRRHPTVFRLALLLMLGSGAIWWGVAWYAPSAHANAVALTPTLLEPVTAGQIAQLRRDAGLENEALSCINASQQNLESALTSLRTWYESNAGEWNSRRRALADQRALVRVHRSAIDNGQDASAQLRAAEQAVGGLEVEYEALLAQCRESVIGGLSDTQRTLLNGMRARRTLPMPYRVLALSPEQESGLRAALLRYEQRRSVSHTAEGQAAALDAFMQERDTALGAAHLQTLASLQSYLSESSQRVVAAVNEVLPTTPEP